LQQLIESAIPIEVDVEMFEKNDPFQVRRETDLETSTSKVMNTYTIELLGVDPRWIASNSSNLLAPSSHEAFYIPPNRVLMKVPSSTWTFQNDPKSEMEALVRSGIKDHRQIQAYNISYTNYIQNPSRHFKSYLLIFPEELDNTVYEPNSMNGSIQYKLATVGTKYSKRIDGNLHPVVEFHENLHWTIAILDDKKRNTKLNEKADVDELIDSVTKGLGNLFFGV